MNRSLTLFSYLAIFLGCYLAMPANHLIGDDDLAKQLIEHVKQSIQNAENGHSKLSKEILSISGYSSPKVRHFLNNLCSAPGTRYLEIGVWKGSTFVSALFGNEQSIDDAVAIDNWSEFGGPKNLFLKNCSKFLVGCPFRFYEANCFKIDAKAIFPQQVNTYFFDGEHTAISQELALTYYNDVLDDVFIVVIDDWNFKAVQLGTEEALRKMNYEILFKTNLPSSCINDAKNWWNGLFVAVLRKTK